MPEKSNTYSDYYSSGTSQATVRLRITEKGKGHFLGWNGGQNYTQITDTEIEFTTAPIYSGEPEDKVEICMDMRGYPLMLTASGGIGRILPYDELGPHAIEPASPNPTVTLTAVPEWGSEFLYWTIGDTYNIRKSSSARQTDNPTDVDVDADGTAVNGEFKGDWPVVYVLLTFDDGPMGFHRYKKKSNGDFETDASGEYYYYLKPGEEHDDDGHSTKAVPATRGILDFLASRHIGGVFFIATHRNVGPHGGASENGSRLVREMNVAGHKVGIHYSWNHPEHDSHVNRATKNDTYKVDENGWYDYDGSGEDRGEGSIPVLPNPLPEGRDFGLTALDCDMVAGSRRLDKVLGGGCGLVRPPYGAGKDDPKVLAVYGTWGLDKCMWHGEVDSGERDYLKSLGKAIEDARKNKIPEITFVALMHDQHSWEKSELEGILKSIEAKIDEDIEGKKAKFGGYVVPE